MKYNSEYDCWVSKEGLIFRATKTGKLRLLKVFKKDGNSYYMVALQKPSNKLVHRVVWETFNGPIPEGYQIDHKNDNRFDNRIDNLQLLTVAENNMKEHRRNALHNAFVNKPRSVFGIKFFEIYGQSKTENPTLYARELQYYKRHGHLKGELNA
jgi:hypothetical protein